MAPRPGLPQHSEMTTSNASEPVPTRWTKATVFDDMWVDPADDPREADTEITNENDLLLDFVRSYRLTIDMKCADLDAEQLAQRSVPPSTMSLLGLVRHLAEDERHIRRVMAGEDAPKLYCTAENRDGDWNGAVADPAVVEDAWRQWRTEGELTDEFVAGADLDSWNAAASDFGPDGADVQLRDIMIEHIAEYARHCGHADLLRERIDGRVGQ